MSEITSSPPLSDEVQAQPLAQPLQGGYAARKTLSRLVIHTILILVAVGMIFPLLWMLASSFKAPSQQITWPPQFIPRPFYPQNFINLFALAPMGIYLLNSLKIAVFSVVGVCFSSSLAAFAFARLRFRGKNVIFAVLLATMMIPGATTVIPTFVIFRNLGWIDTHYPLIVPSFFGSAYMVFLLRQAFLAIPQDLMDAAEIDGAGYFYIYANIFLPLGMPILTTVAMITFLWNWNDLFGPLIYLSTQLKMTVQLGLAYLRGRSGTGVEKYGVIMAGSLMGVLPMLLLYAMGQKYFVQGLTRTGIKG
jgi:multiple sugar transport system permease protein